MTLRAYRPNEPTNGNDQQDWQDTLLDRPMNSRQSSLHVAYGSEPRSKVWLLTGIFALAAILVTGYFVMQGRSGGDSIPLITADTAPYKTAPDTPGGAEIPFQDKLVFNRLDPNGKPVQAEKLLPPPEEPMPAPAAAATTTVTRTVTAPPATVTAPTPAAAPVESVAAAPAETTPTVATPTTPATVTTTKTAINPKTGTTATTTTVASAPVAAAPATETEDASTPEPTPTPAPVVAAVAPVAKPTPAVTAPVASSTAAGGNVRIQLASIPDQSNAQKALPTLSSKYGSALGNAKLSLVKAEIAGKGTYWRVQSQTMDKASADSICSAVKAQGGVCITAK